MRASRLLSTLLLLQAKGRVTAQVLAEEFEVSVRTVYRDIDQLSAAGVPVYADRGAGGGFALIEGYRTRLTGMTAAEAEALSIAGLPDVASELGLSERLHLAQLKLAASLPQACPDISRIGSRLHIDPVGWYRRPASAPDLARIADAVWEQRRLSVHYAGWTAKGERILEPLGLVLKAGNWYLVASSRAQTRIYRVAGISRLNALDGTFARPPRFNLREEWSAAVRRFETEILRETATLRVTQAGIVRLPILGAEALARAQYGPVASDGRQEITLPVERLDHAAEQLFGLGPDVQVIAPVELVAMIRGLAERMLALHEGLAGLGRRRAGRATRAGAQRCIADSGSID